MNQDVPAYPNKIVSKFLYTCHKQNIEKKLKKKKLVDATWIVTQPLFALPLKSRCPWAGSHYAH